MRQIAVTIWIIFAIVGAGASILLALDMFRPRTRIGRFWGMMLVADAICAISLILALVMSRSRASTISLILGLSLLLVGQGIKTATAGACALHMRGSLNGSRNGSEQPQEAKNDPE